MNEHPKASAIPLDITQLQNLEQLRDDEFWDYARTLARRVPVAAQSEDYLECALGTGTCLIPLTTLNEVVLPPHRLTLLPATPEWMPGIVAWRGEAIAVIDLTLYLSGLAVDLSNAILLIVNHANQSACWYPLSDKQHLFSRDRRIPSPQITSQVPQNRPTFQPWQPSRPL